MMLSPIGQKMAAMSGLRSIMEDIATSTAHASDEPWLNLSIGNPAPIPAVTAAWRQLTASTLAEDFENASCSYGSPRGTHALVDAIVDYFNRAYNWGICPENVVVGPGSQFLCFVAAAIFAGGGPLRRLVLPLTPDYTGYQGLCLHPDGVAGVEPQWERGPDHYFRYTLNRSGLEQRADIGMLLVSNPSNPAGRCLDSAEMRFLTRIAQQREVPLVVDNAYGRPFPQIGQTLVAPTFSDTVINCFSMSKAGLPGERIGFAIGPERYITPMVSFIANSLLHAPRLAQVVVAKSLQSGLLDTLCANAISPFYASRRQLAEELLAGNLPADIDWRLHAGQGGMFCWLWINESWFDDLALYRRLKLKHVFVAPGRSFFLPDHEPSRARWHGTQCFRISLTPDEATVTEGIRRTADALRDMSAEHASSGQSRRPDP
jgi:valine--pyruvate aminotransferase